MRTTTSLVAVTLAAAASTALAHGPQIELTRNATTGKIETRDVYDTHAAPTSIPGPVRRAYVMPLLPSGTAYYVRPDATPNLANGQPTFFSNPGIAYQYDAKLPGTGWEYQGSSSLPNLQGSNFAYTFTDGLKIWDGTTFVDPGTEQVRAYRGPVTSPAATAITADSGGMQSLALATIGPASGSPPTVPPASGNPHSTVGYHLVGDPSNAATLPGDGVYLLSLQLSSTAAGVSPSDPFYYLLHKNADPATAMAAATRLGFSGSQVQSYAVVPEPTSLAVLGLGGLLLRLRQRRAV